jgi:DNA-binding MarR family transcriptional regulator
MAKEIAASPLDAHLGFWLRFVSNHVSSRFRLLLESQEGCSVTEWVALRALFDRPGTTHADLIQALGMTKGATSKVVSRLEERGLAKRRLADGSGREQLIVLTRKGMTLVPRLAALADENDAHFFGHLHALEQRALLNALKALVERHELHGPPVS